MHGERQVHSSVLGIPTCLARNCFQQQSLARLDSAQAARENHWTQILATRLREPRPPPIRKRPGGRESWVPQLQLTLVNFFFWKHPSQMKMKIAQPQRYLPLPSECQDCIKPLTKWLRRSIKVTVIKLAPRLWAVRFSLCAQVCKSQAHNTNRTSK